MPQRGAEESRGAALLLLPSRAMELDAPRARLRDALLAHEPADAAEAADRDEILALVLSEPRCFHRGTFAPGHVTGSAFVACRATGMVLLHHHRRLDKWLQMGGHDEGEHDPATTALREAREESGLLDLTLLSPAILDLDVHAIPAGKGEPPHRHHDVRYAAVTKSPQAVRADEAESRAIEWMTLAEAERRMGEPGATRALRKLARLLAG